MDLDMTPDSPLGAGDYPDTPSGETFYLNEVLSALAHRGRLPA
jgi:hypothetical protein